MQSIVRQSAATWQHKGVMRRLCTTSMGLLGEAQALQPHRQRRSTASWLSGMSCRPCGSEETCQTLVHRSTSSVRSLCTSAEANDTRDLAFPGNLLLTMQPPQGSLKKCTRSQQHLQPGFPRYSPETMQPPQGSLQNAPVSSSTCGHFRPGSLRQASAWWSSDGRQITCFPTHQVPWRPPLAAALPAACFVAAGR